MSSKGRGNNGDRGGDLTFDALDEPMSCDESSGPTDTQALRYVRCEVCGKPVYGEPNSDEPPIGSRCAVCDGKIIAATGELLVKKMVPKTKA